MKRLGWGLLLLVLGFVVVYFISGNSQSVRISSTSEDSSEYGSTSNPNRDIDLSHEENAPIAAKLPASTTNVTSEDEEGFHGRRLDNIPERKSRAHAPAKLDKRVLRNYSAFAGTSWKLWIGARARLQGEQVQADALASVNGYDVFPSSSRKSMELLYEEDHPVVYSENNQRAGIVSGVYILELADNVHAEDLHLEDQFQIIGQFSRTLLIKPLQYPFNFVEVFQVLSQDSNFKTVRIEILGRDYEKF